MKRITFAAGVAAGYVLGTRAGKQRYEQIKAKAEKVWTSDQVQDKVEVAKRTLSERAPVVADKVGAATRSATGGLRDKTSGGGGTSADLGGTSTDLGGTTADLDQDTIDLSSAGTGAGTLGSATLGTGVTGDDQRTPGMGPGGDRLP